MTDNSNMPNALEEVAQAPDLAVNPDVEVSARVRFAVASYSAPTVPTTTSLMHMAWDMGRNSHHMVSFGMAERTLICGARHALVEAAANDEMDFILFLDSDMVYTPNMARVLVRKAILNRWPIVSGYYAMRHEPHTTMLYIKRPNGEAGYSPYLPSRVGPAYKVDATGLGCCLIRMDVFAKIERPWFLLREEITEDMYFFEKVRAAGIDVIVDTSLQCAHMGEPRWVLPSANGGGRKPDMGKKEITCADRWIREHQTVREEEEA